MEVMLDLEALHGFHPHPAVLARGRITAIGAVRFSACAPEFDVVSQFATTIPVEAPDGGEIDGATLAWWLGQPSQAKRWGLSTRRSVGVPQLPTLREALQQFDLWLNESDRVWCHYYDKVLLLGAWSRLLAHEPRGFTPHKLRDFGAVEKVVELCGVELPDRQSNKAHEPVDDAIGQARVLHAFVQKCKVRA